jgi:hypothetical protein
MPANGQQNRADGKSWPDMAAAERMAGWVSRAHILREHRSEPRDEVANPRRGL